MPGLVEAARLPAALREPVRSLAHDLVSGLRATRSRSSGVDALMKEFSLSSQEGVALMCLAEALLRVPDKATADRLIRDKLADGDWRAHIGNSPSLFVNAATWGLLITGRLVSTSSAEGLSSALTRLVARGGEPLIRKGMDLAMRMLGEQFVTGRDIDEALKRGREHEHKGYRYSFDMLGEAAMTAADAERYFKDYERAIEAIGRASKGRGVVDGNGISVKLSALHPRYTWSQRERVLAELLPKLKTLCLQARRHDIGLNIDAEEADRLDISLDLLEALALDDALAGWTGLGFVVQAYQKRAPQVLDFVIDLARRSGQRMMVRLVKGAYWDAEIKRAQIDGLAGYPVVYAQGVHRRVLPRLRRRNCSPRATPSTRSSPPTTRTRWRRSSTSPPPTAAPGSRATTSSSACTAWASRSTTRSSARPAATAWCASTRRWAATRPCSPTWCAACSRTAPTPAS